MIKKIICIVFLASFFPYINTYAALISRDWLILGDAALTYDTETGIEWLDLTKTSDMSYNEVASQLSSGGSFEGFTYASEQQVLTLFKAVNLQETALGQSADGPKIEELLNFWGTLWLLGLNGGRSEFIILNTEGLPAGEHWTGRVVWTESGDTGVAARMSTRDDNYKSVTVGSALIRTASPVVVDGDVNGDGNTNPGDLVIILQVVLGYSIGPGIEPGRADFYPQGAPDGIINLQDLILMRNLIL